MPGSWRKERERAKERAGQDIITALRSEAEKNTKEANEKIDTLKEKMLEAIQHPYSDGPKLSATYTGGPKELTSQALADWCNNLLQEADIEGWSESELHDVLCHC